MSSSLPNRGGFDGAVVAGAHDGRITASLDDAPLFGLRRESAYVYATVRGVSGALWTAMRRFQDEEPHWPPRLLLHGGADSAGLTRHDAAGRTAASGAVRRAADTEALHFDAVDERGRLALELRDDRLRWADGEALSLTSVREVRPGLQWYLPESGNSMAYVSRIFEVEGLVAGHPVKGFAGFDEVYLDPARRNYVDDPITAGHLSHGWITWAARYVDGTVEAGHMAFGRERFGFAVRVDADGSVVVGRAISGVVERDEQGPSRATFRVDEQSWSWERDEFGAMPSAAGPVVAAEGRLRRVGDDRPVEVWMGAMEIPGAVSSIQRDARVPGVALPLGERS